MRRCSFLAAALISASLPFVQGCASTRERQVSNRVHAVEGSRSIDALSEQLPENASLRECQLYAARHNPGLAAAFNHWQAAVERIPQVRALPDPHLSYTYYLQSVETRVGPQNHAFALSQTFPWFGKLAARGDAAVETAQAAEQRFAALRLRLFSSLGRAYAENYYLSRALGVTQQNLDLMVHWEQIARAKFRAGTGTHAEVVQAQVEIGMLSDRLRTLNDRQVAVLAEVNALLARPPGAPLSPPDSLLDASIALTDDELLAELPEQSPELLALGFEVERARHELDLAAKDFFPDLTLGSGYVFTGTAVNPESPESGKDPLTAFVSINVPIWRGKYAAKTREAQARLSAAHHEREDLSLQLAAAVKTVAFELRDAGRKVRLYRDTLIPKGDQSLSATSAAFEAGQLEFLNVIDAQRVLLEFNLSYERALADQLTKLAELEMLVGRELPRASGLGRE